LAGALVVERDAHDASGRFGSAVIIFSASASAERISTQWRYAGRSVQFPDISNLKK